MRALTIRQKLLLLTLLPMLVLLVVILGYFLHQDNKLMYEALLKRGESVSRYFASAAEYGVITGNFEQLQHISGSVLQGDVVALRVYDFDERVVFTSGEVSGVQREALDRTHRGVCGVSEDRLLFCAPILLAALPVSDYESSASVAESSSIGSIEMTVDTHFIAQKRMQMLRWSLLLVLAVFVMAVMLSRRMERQLVEPLTNLSRIVEQVRDGDLGVQVSETASGELLLLQQGVNAMVAALANAKEYTDHEIAAATDSLRTALQQLEQRNRELQREQQRAQSASLAKSRFLATMSHEIRTPLSGMIGMLQMLRDNSANRRQLDYVDCLESAAQSLRQLIDDILDFSRLEVGKLAIRNQTFAPLAIVEEVMVMLAPSAHHKGLEFVLDMIEPLPDEVVGDPLRFRQVLINLAANAIKFTKQGEVLVQVRRAMAASGTERWRFEIHDTGIGIAKEQQARVFESFTQLDDGDARNYGGSGLGTTVSRELVEMMGGAIGLESERGKGSCFWFELPWESVAGQHRVTPREISAHALVLEHHHSSAQAVERMLLNMGIKSHVIAEEHQLRPALQQQNYDWLFIGENSSESENRFLLERLAGELPESIRLCQIDYVNGIRAESARISHLHKPLIPSALKELLLRGVQEKSAAYSVAERRPLSVLLAEDEAINAKVITHFLTQGGHQVVRVEDGEAALQQLRDGKFDCVLMDLRMPGMDGLEATRLWRAGESGQRLPIIALTANASEEDRRRCTEAGMDDYLTKPVDSQRLLATLERHCQPA